MPFRNSVLGGSGTLVRTQEQSENFVTGVSGWQITRAGNVEFNSGVFRGTVTAGTFAGTDFVINTSGAFFYSGVPAAGNLIYSIASVGGTDSFGNHYLQGAAGYSTGGTVTVADSLANQSTRFIQVQAGSGVQLVGFSPDLATWNSGSIESVSGNGHLIITAPQAKLDGGNGAVITLVPANPAGGANAAINATADKYAFTATNDTVNITANGGVQVDPLGSSTATHAFIAGTIGSGSVNWYRGSANRWATDDGVDMAGTLTLGASDTGLQRDAAAVIGVTNAVVGHGESWHAPSYGTNWSGSTTFNGLTALQTLQYRQDAEDNIWLQGQFKAGGTLPANPVFTLPAGWRPATQQLIPVYRNNGGTVTSGLAFIGTSGNVSLFAGGGTGIAINNEYSIDAKFPRGVIT